MIKQKYSKQPLVAMATILDLRKSCFNNQSKKINVNYWPISKLSLRSLVFKALSNMLHYFIIKIQTYIKNIISYYSKKNNIIIYLSIDYELFLFYQINANCL